MKNLARGSVLLSFAALIVSLFYVQPQVGAAFFSADSSNSHENPLKLNTETSVVAEATAEITEENTEDTKLIENKAANSANRNAARGFSATAYCLRGRTATGGSVRRGIVAADPRVLPLGTRIQMNAGGYSGTYIVADTGGAVKGRKLDIWVPSCSEAIRFGRRSVTVSVLGRK
jgi:3D (Asp-Asp-Asp) domain-containing protein